jgi:hypothetical protein
VPSTLDAATVTIGLLGDGVEHVSWSEDGYDGPHLLVMRRFGDPDGYCVIVNGNPHYGGVLAFDVTPGETALTLTAGAADELGLERAVTLRYDPESVDAGELRAVLGRLLA